MLGEANVADADSEIATEAAGDNDESLDRIERERTLKDYRRAQERGLTAQEYEDQKYDDINERLAEKAPSTDEYEEVAVVVYFPKIDPDYEGQREALLIRSRVSTLAISGLTPDQAESLRSAQEGSIDPGQPAAGEGGGR